MSEKGSEEWQEFMADPAAWPGSTISRGSCCQHPSPGTGSRHCQMEGLPVTARCPARMESRSSRRFWVVL